MGFSLRTALEHGNLMILQDLDEEALYLSHLVHYCVLRIAAWPPFTFRFAVVATWYTRVWAGLLC